MAANTSASIDLLVTGRTAVDRLIERVSRLDAVVNRINSSPLDVSRSSAARSLEQYEIRLKEAQNISRKITSEIKDAQKEIGRLTEKKLKAELRLSSGRLGSETKTYKALQEQVLETGQALDVLNAKTEELGKTQQQARVAVRQLERGLISAQNSSKTANALQDIAEQYLKIGDTRKKLSSGKTSEKNVGLDISVNQLKEQASALSLVANNVKIASSDFNKFSIAIEGANKKLAEAEQQRFRAVAFGLSPQAQSQNVGRGTPEANLAGSRKLIASALAMGDTVTRSEAAMDSYLGYLERLRSLVPVISNEYRALEERIASVREEMSGFGLRGQSMKIQPQLGPASRLDDPKTFKKRKDYYDKIESQLDRIAALETRVDQAYLSQNQKLELRQKLDKAASLLAERDLVASKRQTAEIDRQRISLERLNRRGSPMPATQEERAASTRMSWGTALAQMEEIAKQIELEARQKGKILKIKWGSALTQGMEIASQLNEEANRKKARVKLSWGGALTQLTETAANLDRASKARSGAVKLSWMSALDNFSSIAEENKAIQQAKGAKIKLGWNTALAQLVETAAVVENDAASKNAKIKLSWGSALAQGAEIGQELATSIASKKAKIKMDWNLALAMAQEAIPSVSAAGAGQKQAGFMTSSAAFSPVGGQKRLRNIQASGQVLEQKLLALRAKGVNVDERLNDLQTALNASKQEGYDISLRNLGVLDDELNATRQLLNLERARAEVAKSQESTAAKAASKANRVSRQTGSLTSILGDLGRASSAAKVFRGGRSGEQALSNIINAFNRVQQTQATRGSAARPADDRTGVEKEIDRYKQIFAGLTSNPRFYGELLSKLPREAITTTMAGAATEREASIRRPGLSVFRPGGGPGDLEGQILSEYQKVFGTVPSGVKQLFDKIGSVFDAIVGRPTGGGGGGRPPIRPGGPSGPGDFGNEINSARGNTQRLLGLADIADMSGASIKELQLFSQALSETREGVKMTDASFNQLTKAIDKVDDRIARTDPNADLLVRGFGRRGGQAVGEGLIGGAFPLLFGQGGGAALGGGLGGALGGFAGGTLGFGLSLAGTAIGSQVDLLAQAAQDTGNLLGELSSDVSGSFEKIKEAGLLASRSQEKLVASLLEAGNKTAAYAIIQEELNNKLGVDGAEKLRAAADAGDRLKRAMADLGIELQLLVAGPLTKFLNAVSGALEQRGRAEQARTVFGELPADKREKFIQELTRENVKRGGTKENIQGAELFAQITEKLDAATIRSITEKLATSQPRKQTDAEKRQETIRNAETGLARVQRGLDAVNKRNEGAELVKGFKQQALAAKREQEDLDRQAFELRRDYERQIEDIRRGIEDRINQIRQENQQRELEILVKQGQIREQQFKNASTALQSALAGDPLAQSLADAVTTYLGAQMSAQDQLEQRRKQFEIEITNQQLETEKFKLEVGRTLSRLNTDTAEKVAEINKGVRRNNENAALNEFNLQKESASLRAEVIRNELLVLQAKQKDFVETAKFRAQESPSPENTRIAEAEQKRLDIFTGALADAAANIQTIKQTQPPQLLREISAPAAKSVSFAGVNQGIARAGQLREQLKRLEKELLDLVKGGNLELFAKQLGEIVFGSFFELNNSLRNAKQEAASASGDVSASIQAVTDSYSEFFALAQQTGVNIDEPTRKFIEEIRDGQIAFEKIKPSMEFYASNLQDITAQTKQSRAAIDELLLPTKAYDRELAKINARGGLGINPEEEQLLLKNARALDEINAKLRVLEGLRDIASGWTDSFIQLNKELLKGGNLLESVQRFAESVADRTLDVVLEFTLRPIQERLFKNMTDILGIKAPEDPALQPIRETAANTKVLADKAKKEFAGKTGVPLSQPVAAQAPANGIVPGPGAMAQRQGYPEYIDKSVLRNWLISRGMGRTSGDFTNAGHRTPNHMLNAMDMGFIDPKYDSNYVQKTKEMEAKLRATGAFGNQLFGPTSDPGGHGTHLHIPTPGGRVKVTPGLAQLMGLSQPMQQGQTYPSVGNGQPVEVSVVDAPALMASSLKGPGQAYPIPASQLPSGGAVPGQPVQIQQVPFVEPQPESPVTPAANQAAKSLANLDETVRKAVEGFTSFGESMSEFATKTTDSVTKFQQIVGTGLQAISSVAMGIGGAQMIRKGGTYNTLMGAASIFGSISSITGMFGAGGPLPGLFGSKAPSATASNFMMPQLTGVPGGARALGGPVFKGEEYLVGEEGPEVIRMGANGTVIPADELYVPGLDDRDSSSAPPIGRYARRSNASSDMADGDSERSVYGDTYERGSSSTTYIGNYGRTVPYQRSETSREIDRLERVTSSPSELPPIKYETTRVNEYDFVTPEQLEASSTRTAKVARNQTIRELADSLKTRKRLGL